MDAECVELCDVLNELPGITTCESCCGHGVYPFQIFFNAVHVKNLRPILLALDAHENWYVTATWASGSDSIYFSLTGPLDADTRILIDTINKNS